MTLCACWTSRAGREYNAQMAFLLSIQKRFWAAVAVRRLGPSTRPQQFSLHPMFPGDIQKEKYFLRQCSTLWLLRSLSLFLVRTQTIFLYSYQDSFRTNFLTFIPYYSTNKKINMEFGQGHQFSQVYYFPFTYARDSSCLKIYSATERSDRFFL